MSRFLNLVLSDPISKIRETHLFKKSIESRLFFQFGEGLLLRWSNLTRVQLLKHVIHIYRCADFLYFLLIYLFNLLIYSVEILFPKRTSTASPTHSNSSTNENAGVTLYLRSVLHFLRFSLFLLFVFLVSRYKSFVSAL